jgi:hypothetical protein
MKAQKTLKVTMMLLTQQLKELSKQNTSLISRTAQVW